jgi:hypothetical protein
MIGSPEFSTDPELSVVALNRFNHRFQSRRKPLWSCVILDLLSFLAHFILIVPAFYFMAYGVFLTNPYFRRDQSLISGPNACDCRAVFPRPREPLTRTRESGGRIEMNIMIWE